MSIVAEVQKHREERKNAGLAVYQDIVRAIADNEPRDLDRISDAMSAAGKSDADLARDIDRYNQRKVWAAQYAELNSLRVQRDETIAKVLQADERLKAAQFEHRQAVGPLREAANGFELRIVVAENARGSLIREGGNPAILAREQKLTNEVKRLDDEHAKIKDDLGVRRAGSIGNGRLLVARELEKLKASAGKWMSVPGVKSKHRDEIAALQKQLAEIDKVSVKPAQDRLEAIAKRRGEIDTERAKCDAERLKP